MPCYSRSYFLFRSQQELTVPLTDARACTYRLSRHMHTHACTHTHVHAQAYFHEQLITVMLPRQENHTTESLIGTRWWWIKSIFDKCTELEGKSDKHMAIGMFSLHGTFTPGPHLKQRNKGGIRQQNIPSHKIYFFTFQSQGKVTGVQNMRCSLRKPHQGAIF